MVKRPGQSPGVVDVEKSTGTLLSQASFAVTVGGFGTLSHSTVVSDGTPTSWGLVLSWISMVCTQVEEPPQASVAVQVRVMV